MSERPIAVRGERILTPDGWRAGAVLMRGGRIEALIDAAAAPAEAEVHDVGAAVITPGVVDTHVHLNEPGRTAWEGFETGTRAAAAGGITTLVDMPLNSDPVTTTARALALKQEAARGRLWVDMGFWGGIVPGNAGELAQMVHLGALGFKAFMCHSGIDDFPAATETDLRLAMAILSALGVPLLVHAELEAHAPPEDPTADPRRYATFLASRPPAMEIAAVELVIKLCRETRCPVHVVHLSTAGALDAIARAKAEGLPITVETCPHYLVFAAEEIPDGATAFKCAPPIREAANRERLWQGLADGTIDFVACDHSPCTPELKKPEEGDFMAAWGGIASVQFSLPAVWTHARARGHALEEVLGWLTGRTAAFAGQAKRKGAIAPGFDADLAVWYPDATLEVRPEGIFHRHPVSPYLGRTLNGVVESTWLRGERVYHQGVHRDAPTGCFLPPRAGTRA